MSNFAEILNLKSDQIEKPKPLPVGTYLWTVVGLPKIGPLGKQNTGAAEYTVRCVGPQPDVNPEELAKMGGCQGKEVRLTFWLTNDAVYRWKEFLEDHLGIQADGRPIGQYHNDAVNRQFLGQITHSPSADGTTVYANISKTMAA